MGDPDAETRTKTRGVPGLPEIVDDETVFRTTAQEFVQYIPELIQAGAGFIGGCCGTDQGFVKAIRETVDNL